MKSTPYLLALPALLLFAVIVVVPLGMTVALSFHDWGQYKGIEPVFILKNWKEVFTDSYYGEMFARTFRIALLVTLITAVVGAMALVRSLRTTAVPKITETKNRLQEKRAVKAAAPSPVQEPSHGPHGEPAEAHQVG